MKPDIDIKAFFGRRIRELRLAQRLSQEKLGQICGLDRTYISGVERGHRNISLENIYALSNALDINVSLLFKGMPDDTSEDILQRWQLSDHEFTAIVESNPSLRGFLLGYIAEHKLQRFLLQLPHVSGLHKPDDHDRRARSKSDLIIIYKGREFSFESKSLQTNSIKRLSEDGRYEEYEGRAQVDASDRRPVMLPDGSQIQTTCLLAGQFDILALSLYQFRNQWEFAFILNEDLPKSSFRKYTPYQRQHLLATTVKVTLPVESPFTTSPVELLDKLINTRST